MTVPTKPDDRDPHTADDTLLRKDDPDADLDRDDDSDDADDDAAAATDPEARDDEDDEFAEDEDEDEDDGDDDEPDSPADVAEDEDRDGGDIDDEDRDGTPDFAPVEPAPVPTAFGAATVGGAVAASTLADERDRGDRSTVGDSPVTDDLDRRADDGAVTAPVAADHAVGIAPVAPVRPDHAEPTEEDVAGPSEPVAADDATVDTTATTAPEDTAAVEAAEPGTELLPGAVPAGPVTALWDESTAQTFRVRWRELQLRFVDDPHAATDEAQALVGEAVDALTAALVEQRTDLDGWRSGEGQDTENLRVALRRYRDFFDRLLSR